MRSTTSTATGSTWASSGQTRMRSGAWEPTTSRWCCTWPARSPGRSWPTASHTSATGVEDVVFCFLRFPSGLSAHLHLSWLDPHKERRFTVVGSRRMATFDDMALEGKLTVYDKGFDEDSRGYGEYITRSGDIFSPRIPNVEPLRLECEHFVECIRSGERHGRTAPAACALFGCSSSCSVT